MTEPRSSLYRRHRYPSEIIAEAVWLYFRFPLSFRMVEDMLAYRGIFVTYKTVYEWAEKFGRAYASNSVAAHRGLAINGTWMNV
ncbi:IS6 family transposase [Bacillus sp. PR5]|nr:IS6 family transposase [Bacillus sp. PR5]